MQHTGVDLLLSVAMSLSSDDFTKKKKLEANFAIYTKLAEREYLGNNLKSASKAFRNVN